jgi:LysR family transcriptional regulator, benzoate and cis,cis-muconate-responsive activator of ben and cat genes
MDLRHLRHFQAVAEELSFSRAATRLHVAQPALSRTVKELEETLGAPLLERNRRTVRLTPVGAVLLNETGLLLQRFDEAMRRVRRTAAGEEGELRLGYIGPPTQAFLGRILQEYRRRCPRVSVHLEERTPERVWEMVARRRLAVALTRPVPGHEAIGLRTLLLRREPLAAVFPHGHRLAARKSVRWTDLAHQPLVILARREGVGLHDTILTACRQAKFAPRLAHAPSLMTTVLSYVEAGAGVGIMADSVVPPASASILTARPLSPLRAVDLVMVWSDEEDSPPVAAFRHLVAEWKQKHLLWPAKP